MNSKDNNNDNYNKNKNFEALGKVLASPNKKKVLYSLSYPKTPKEITKDTNLNFPITSKIIKELEELKLIKIENKEFRKGKIIEISNKGKEILKDLDKRKK
jgi:DNA-binding MarR family transcriptional regulator